MNTHRCVFTKKQKTKNSQWKQNWWVPLYQPEHDQGRCITAERKYTNLATAESVNDLSRMGLPGGVEAWTGLFDDLASWNRWPLTLTPGNELPLGQWAAINTKTGRQNILIIQVDMMNFYCWNDNVILKRQLLLTQVGVEKKQLYNRLHSFKIIRFSESWWSKLVVTWLKKQWLTDKESQRMF